MPAVFQTDVLMGSDREDYARFEMGVSQIAGHLFRPSLL